MHHITILQFTKKSVTFFYPETCETDIQTSISVKMLHFFKNFSAYSGKNTLTTLLKNGQRTSHKNTIRNHSGSMKVTVIGAAGQLKFF